MKKTFTLLCMGALALTAMAAPKHENLAGMQVGFDNLNESVLAPKIAKMNAMIEANDPSVITRSFTDNRGEWNCAFMVDNEGWDQFGIYYIDKETGEKVYLKFPEVGLVLQQTYTTDRKTNVIYLLAWPTEYLYNQVWGRDANFDPNDETTYDYTLVDPSVLMNNNDDDNTIHTFESCSFLDGTATDATYTGGFPYNPDETGKSIVSWSMIPVNAIYTNKCYYNDNEVTLVFPNAGNNVSTIEFNSFDESNRYMDLSLRYCYQATNGSISNFRVNYEGTGSVKGFKMITSTMPKLTEIHVFKDGLYDEDAQMTDLGYLSIDIAPAYRYWLLGIASESLTLSVKTNDFTFSDDNIVVGWIKDAPQSDKEINYFYGALYLDAEGEEFTNGVYAMAPMTYEQEPDPNDPEKLLTYPGVHPTNLSCITSAYNYPFCGKDGMCFFIAKDGSYYETKGDKVSYVQFGSTEGFTVNLYDVGGDRWIANGDIEYFYHYDPSDIRNYDKKSTVGTDEPFVGVQNVLSEPSKLNVTVENGMIVAPAGSQIYDLNGRAVNAENAAKGIYVVRNGKQAVKVLVK